MHDETCVPSSMLLLLFSLNGEEWMDNIGVCCVYYYYAVSSASITKSMLLLGPLQQREEWEAYTRTRGATPYHPYQVCITPYIIIESNKYKISPHNSEREKNLENMFPQTSPPPPSPSCASSPPRTSLHHLYLCAPPYRSSIAPVCHSSVPSLLLYSSTLPSCSLSRLSVSRMNAEGCRSWMCRVAVYVCIYTLQQ